MKELKHGTKRANHFIDLYWYSDKSDLRECYTTCSREKLQAQRACKAQMIQEKGYGFRILSWNTFQFTCGWLTLDSTMRIETATNSYYIKNADLPF